MTKDLGKFLTSCAADKVKILSCVEDASSGEAMNMRMVGEVVAEGMDGEDDASTPIG